MLRVRWLGTVSYEDAHALQRSLHSRSKDEYVLMLEHPHVVTLGVRGDPSHVLVDPASHGASLVNTDRGGDVTYHGPGQLVVYPIVDVPMHPDAVPQHVRRVEQLAIDTLAGLGLHADRLPGYPGVWVDAHCERPRKICAVGVRVSRGRSMHGLAMNVKPDLEWFKRIVPCGLDDMEVTSLSTEGIDVPMQEVIDLMSAHAVEIWASAASTLHERRDVSGRAAGSASGVDVDARMGQPGQSEGGSAPQSGGPLRVRLRQAGVEPGAGFSLHTRKPPWLRLPAQMGEDFLALKRTVRGLDLVTVCEEAGCPNIFECWEQGTATFMINGERCTRACGFCLVDTRRPMPLDPQEPDRLARAVEHLGLDHVVITAVARDDLPDGGAGAFAASMRAVRSRCPGTSVEVLVPDFKGERGAQETVLAERPDVFNHNIETVPRLQRAIRPSAGYARSLAVLARAKDAAMLTKSGLMLGMGEDEEEVISALSDLRAVGVDIVTIGHYLRPSAWHVPVARWWTPDDFARLGSVARAMGFAHVQSSPLTRSSYHARAAAGSARAASEHSVKAGTSGGALCR